MVQRRAVRWTLNSYSTYASITKIQNRLGLRTPEQRRAYQDSVSLTGTRQHTDKTTRRHGF